MIIHISGSPGSGKSTIGKWIDENYSDSIAVKDTDSFIQRGDEEATRLSSLFIEGSDAYMNELRMLKTRKINEFIASNSEKDIVFVGLMDHFGLKPFYDISLARHKFFIQISNTDLLKQYYSRLAFLYDGTTWDDYILSSTEKIKENEDLWLEHKEYNYILASQDDIKNFIITLHRNPI
jgi:hypothetical protein